MRCAVLFVVACAFAGALGVPVSRQSAPGSVTDGTQAVFEKIKKLVESHNEVVRKIITAKHWRELEPLQKDAKRINEELRSAFEELRELQDGPSSGPSDGEELSTKERLRKKISEIRKAIASATSELASIIWQQALAHGGKLAEGLAIAKQKTVKRLTELKDELLVKLRELMIPVDDVPVTYVVDEIFEQIVAGLKNQISDALKVMSDWHNLLTESGRAKMAAAKKRITELAQKIADTIREWRRAKEESSSTTEGSNYESDPFYDDQLMLMLKELLEEFKDQLELKKLEISKSSIEAEKEILVHLEEVDAQLTTSIGNIREMIEQVAGVEVASHDIVANLRK